MYRYIVYIHTYYYNYVYSCYLCYVYIYILYIYCLYVCVHVTSCWFRQPTGPNRLGAGNFRDQQRMCSLCRILRLPGPHWDLRLAWSSTGHLKLSERIALQNCHSASFAFTLPEQPMIECVDNVLKMRWLCVDICSLTTQFNQLSHCSGMHTSWDLPFAAATLPKPAVEQKMPRIPGTLEGPW